MASLDGEARADFTVDALMRSEKRREAAFTFARVMSSLSRRVPKLAPRACLTRRLSAFSRGRLWTFAVDSEPPGARLPLPRSTLFLLFILLLIFCVIRRAAGRMCLRRLANTTPGDAHAVDEAERQCISCFEDVQHRVQRDPKMLFGFCRQFIQSNVSLPCMPVLAACLPASRSSLCSARADLSSRTCNLSPETQGVALMVALLKRPRSVDPAVQLRTLRIAVDALVRRLSSACAMGTGHNESLVKD